MLYLAQTAAEFLNQRPLPYPSGWMACHFSSFGPGLTNLPQALPADSMLIVDDYIPVTHQDPAVVTQQLSALCNALAPGRVLLDFQRPAQPQALEMVQAILEALSCPVGVSECYARDFVCPVFLPPLPPQKTLDACLAPWSGRQIWMEAALTATAVTVTEAGSVYTPCPAPEAPLPFRDDGLCCHYGLRLFEKQAVFTLHRTWEDLQKLMQTDQVSCFVGLYQELKDFV